MVSSVSGTNSGDSKRVNIFYFSDYHGNIPAYRHLKAASDEFDKNHKDTDNFKLSGGDLTADADPRKRILVYRLIKNMNIDASAVGNHEPDHARGFNFFKEFDKLFNNWQRIITKETLSNIDENLNETKILVAEFGRLPLYFPVYLASRVKIYKKHKLDVDFITSGGEALTAYNEYRKVVVEQGIYKVENKRIALKHRLSIGTIVGDNLLYVKYVSGKYLGTIEEYFISRLNTGDVFWFAGQSLELVRIKEMEVHVRKSKKKSGKVPSWQGGRMPLSSQLSEMIRFKIDEAARGAETDDEMRFLRPLMNLQRERSHLPAKDEFLIEYFHSSEGYHVVMYPFEGRFVHEGMAALIAYRISQTTPITFSIAMNDYGFELLSDQEIPIYEAVETNVLGSENLMHDIQASINSTEMARRKFRDIAAISGLIFKGLPGQKVKERHLQSSSQLFFNVFHEYESHNLLLQQAFEEVMDFQLEEARLRKALIRIAHQKIIITEPDKPGPFQ